MIMTQKHINFALAIILILGWFMPLGYDSRYISDSVSLYTVFYESLFYIDRTWVSILKFIVSGSILGLLINYILTHFDNSI